MTSIQPVCLRIPTSLKATDTWARYLASNLLKIVKTAFFTHIQKKMLFPPNVREREERERERKERERKERERERAISSPLCLPKEPSKRASRKIENKK